MSNKLNFQKIGTHNGVFHGDDVMAVACLKLCYPNSEVIRTRDDKVLAGCDIVVDVGAKYDPSTCRYDHHMKERAGVRENGILYSSFGLVWKHHGLELCDGNVEVQEIVDKEIVQPIDALDNGQEMYDNLKFSDRRPYTFSSALSAFNPNWYETSDFDAAFGPAVEFAKIVLEREIASAKGMVRAKGIVVKAIETATDPRLVILDKFCPWQDVVVTESTKALFVAFPSETGDWRLQCVPPTLGSFEKRKSLPAAWAGKRGVDLGALTDVPDAVFAHPGLFICGAESKDGILKLAKLALEA